MNAPLPQSINQARFQDIGAFNSGLVASPFTGSINDAVLLFAAANESIQGPPEYTTVDNSVTLGTSVTLTKKGIYAVELGLSYLAAATLLVAGISQDAANLTADLLISDPGALDASGEISLAAATSGFLKLTTTVFVSPEQQAAGSVIRFHASAADAAPSAMLTALTTYYRIRWRGENNT